MRARWLDYLRSFVTLLVLAHHAALAYPTFAYFDSSHYINSTAPVVDADRWIGMDILIGFNDLFFMALMFLISGLFVYRGLFRKGAGNYLKDRFVRLGIPFLIAEVFLIPLAYIPSYCEAKQSFQAFDFIKDYIAVQQWPVGPPWFIWLLLSFDVVATLLFVNWPSFFPAVGNRLHELSKHPVWLCGVVYGVAVVSLTPLSLWVGQYTWVGNWGPFDFQLNRLLFYLFFFLAGVCLGSTDWQAYMFSHNRFLGKSWPFWTVLCISTYVLFLLISRSGKTWVAAKILTETEWYFLFDLAFVASCLASISACLSVFRQTMNRSMSGWDNLSANAYGIYILHYGFITWLQFSLLRVNIPVSMKFLFVFSVTLCLSWIVSLVSRRSQLIASIM